MTENVAHPAGQRPPLAEESAELLTTREVAKLLRIDPSTVARWRAQGQGPRWIRVALRTVRYRRSDVDRFLADRIRTSTAAA